MDRQIQSLEPDYRRIYSDIINFKYPEKIKSCKTLLQKKNLSVLDILKLNQNIFGMVDKQTETFNQKHRSYDKAAIIEILQYQEKHQLNNTQLALHFKVSRNSVAKWKKLLL